MEMLSILVSAIVSANPEDSVTSAQGVTVSQEEDETAL